VGRRARHVAALLPVAAGILWACGPSPVPPPGITSGSPLRGAETIERFGCGSCHVIPGISEAEGDVGPPLTDFGQRKFIAGAVANNEGNLVRWLLDPDAVEPGTVMPDLGLSVQEAHDVAAYLYSLRR
jgi:cytochrome c